MTTDQFDFNIYFISEYIETKSDFSYNGVPKLAFKTWITSVDLPSQLLENKTIFSKKNDKIPTLQDYSRPPKPEYWKLWPKTSLPTSALQNQGLMFKIIFRYLFIAP